MAISATSVPATNTLNQLRTQFNNLVTDVTGIEAGTIEYNELNTTTVSATTVSVKEDGTIIFEGATNDDFETTLTVADPTADRTITLPDETGTVLLDTSSSATFTGTSTSVVSSANDSTNETVYLTFVDGQTGSQGIETDSDLTYNPSTGVLTTSKVIIDDGGTIGTASDADSITIDASGNVTASQNLIVSGDLTVNGATTTISTTNSVITDQLIELANGVTGPASGDAGIIIERGDDNNAFIGFDESANKFTVGTGTFTGASSGDLTISTGTLVADLEGDVTGNVTAQNIQVGVTGANEIDTSSGNLTLDSAGGTTTVDDNLHVTGTITSDSNITANAIAADDITAGDAAVTLTTTTGNITIDAQASDSDIIFKGTDGGVDTTFLTIDGSEAGNSTFNGSVTAASFSGDLTGNVTGNADTATALATERAIAVSGAVAGTANFDGTAAIDISTTQQADSVTLGTHTTGNYVATITGGTGIDSTGATTGETINHTLSLDLSELTTSTSDGDGDFFVVVDDANAQKKLTKANIALSGFNNDSGFTTNAGTVTSVELTAGAGIDVSGGPITSSGAITVSIESDLRNDVFQIGRDTNDYYIVNTTTHDWYLDGNLDMRLESDGDLHADGDIVAYSTTTSDERLKTDITVVENALEKVKSIRGVEFTYINDGKRSAGVIAQEVEKVLPQAVREKALPLQMGVEDETEYKVLQYDQLHALLIEAVKELSNEIEELKRGITK